MIIGTKRLNDIIKKLRAKLRTVATMSELQLKDLNYTIYKLNEAWADRNAARAKAKMLFKVILALIITGSVVLVGAGYLILDSEVDAYHAETQARNSARLVDGLNSAWAAEMKLHAKWKARAWKWEHIARGQYDIPKKFQP